MVYDLAIDIGCILFHLVSIIDSLILIGCINCIEFDWAKMIICKCKGHIVVKYWNDLNPCIMCIYLVLYNSNNQWTLHMSNIIHYHHKMCLCIHIFRFLLQYSNFYFSYKLCTFNCYYMSHNHLIYFHKVRMYIDQK